MRRIRVVIVTMFEPGETMPGELYYLRERLGLKHQPLASSGIEQAWVNDAGVLAVVAGVGTANTAVALTALGFDETLDISQAYWLITGIAGGNPLVTSLGSPVWADWVVDGDLAHELDARELPEGWSTGIFPLGAAEPYGQPTSPEQLYGTPYQVFQLDPDLVNWAVEQTRRLPLEDAPGMETFRAAYKDFPQAHEKPVISVGAQLAGARFWHGRRMNDWAEGWVRHWTKGAGRFTTSGMEDTGSLQAIRHLSRLGRADSRRVFVLRTVSNFTMPPTGGDNLRSLCGDPEASNPFPGYEPALKNAATVAGTVVESLCALESEEEIFCRKP